MRRIALLIAALALMCIADIAATCGEQVRAAARLRIDGPLSRTVEDWQMATWSAVVVAAWAVAWSVALEPLQAFRPGWRARVTRTPPAVG